MDDDPGSRDSKPLHCPAFALPLKLCYCNNLLSTADSDTATAP